MAQRILTGVISAALLLVVIWVRGLVFDIAVALVCLLCCYEIIGAFCKAGLHPPRFPVYGMAAAMLPLFWWVGVQGVYMAGFLAAMGVMLQITLRKHPAWPDAAASLTALISVLVPLTMMLALIRLEPVPVRRVDDAAGVRDCAAGGHVCVLCGRIRGQAPDGARAFAEKDLGRVGRGAAGQRGGRAADGAAGPALAGHAAAVAFSGAGPYRRGVWPAGRSFRFAGQAVLRREGLRDAVPGPWRHDGPGDSVLFVTYVVFGYCLLSGLI